MIYYGCPKCQAPMASPDGMAGRSETCPQCGNVAAVPAPAAVPVQKVRPESPQKEPQNVKRDNTPRLGMKQCHRCKEWIAEAATKCPRCQSEQPSVIYVIAAVITTVLVVAFLVHVAMLYRSCNTLLDSF